MTDRDTTTHAPRAPAADAWTNPDRAGMKARVRKLQQLMAVFLKAGKTLRLYSEDHRFFNRFASEFETRLNEQHELDESLTFEITPTSIQWDGNTVFQNREQRQNLAFKLYRDGVRLLQFRRGANAAEVRDFVTLIAREGDRSGGSQDLSVLFWEADFKHIHIAVAETFVEYDQTAAETLRRLELDLSDLEGDFGVVAREEDSEVDQLLPAWDQPEGMASAPAGSSNAMLADDDGPRYEPAAYAYAQSDIQDVRYGGEDVFRGLHFQDDTDLPALPAESMDDYAMEAVYSDLHGLERAYASFEEVGGVLAHVLESETDADELTALLRNLDDAMSPLLATAAVGPLNAILRRIALIEQRENEAGSFRAAPLTEFMRNLGGLARFQIIARAINEDWSAAMRGELFTFMSLQHPDSVPALVQFLGQLRPEEPRRTVVEALVLLSNKATEPWLEGLRSANWRLVADSISALGLIADPVALEHVAIAYEREEEAVRLQALETLKNQHSRRIQDLMLRALGDSDSEVRVTALRYCAVNGLDAATPAIEQALRERGFKERPFEERRGWYMTLGMLAGAEVLPRFQKVALHAQRYGEHGPEVHLALLAIRSIRETRARQWLSEFAKNTSGELQLLAHKILAGNR